MCETGFRLWTHPVGRVYTPVTLFRSLRNMSLVDLGSKIPSSCSALDFLLTVDGMAPLHTSFVIAQTNQEHEPSYVGQDGQLTSQRAMAAKFETEAQAIAFAMQHELPLYK